MEIMRDIVVGIAVGVATTLGIIYLAKRLGTTQSGPVGSVAKNLETINWTDWRGRERNITIHREVS